ELMISVVNSACAKKSAADREERQMTIQTTLLKPVTRRTFVASAAALSLGGVRMTRAQALEPLSVRFDFAPWGVHAGLHLAQQRGWFKEVGLDVDLQDGTGT